MEKAREKNIYFVDCPKAFDHVDHRKLCKILKEMEYQTILPVSWETYMWIKKQQLEAYLEQLIGSKLGKEYNKAVYCHPIYLTYIQSTSCKMPGWINQSWNQDCQEKNWPQICRPYRFNGRKWRGNKPQQASWWGWKRRVKKLVLNWAFKTLRSWHLVP